MSYMDRVGGVPRAGAPPETSPPPPPTTTSSPRRPGSSNLPRAPSASSRVAASRSTAAPTQPSLNFTVRREQVSFTKNCIHLSIRASFSIHPAIPHMRGKGTIYDRSLSHPGPCGCAGHPHPSPQTPDRVKAEGRSQDRKACNTGITIVMQVSLGEDLAASLTDGVVLCHIANHCSPRSVSSIHVPSPAVVGLLPISYRGVGNYNTDITAD